MASIKNAEQKFYDLFKNKYSKEFELLEEYKTRSKPIKIKHNSDICNNNVFKLSPRFIKKNKKLSLCPVCNNFLKLKNNIKEKYNRIPYVFLSKYKSVHDKMKVKCKDCGNIFEIRPNNMINNKSNKYHPCVQCSNKRISEMNKLGLDNYMKRLQEKFNRIPYEIKNFDVLNKDCTHICKDCGHEFEARPSNVLNTNADIYCPNCNNMLRDTRDYETRCLDISDNTIKPLEDYISRQSKIKHLCLVCEHVWYPTPGTILIKEGCPKCANIIKESKGEIELKEFLCSFVDNIISKDRSILNTQELDIYLPDFNIAFEYNGLYWHSEKHKGKKYHLEKTEECAKQGVRLIHIFEDEWINQKELIKDKIKHILGFNNNPKIYARKCFVKKISTREKQIFLDKNHIQGKDVSSIKLGLFYSINDKDKLVGVMTFCKLRKSLGQDSKKGYYELSRFATSRDFRVIGGFGKLWKHFIRNYDFKEIITYADRRWSNGNVYKTCNFTFDHYSRPSYWYFHKNNGTQKYHRYKFRKQELKKLFPKTYNDKKTEYQIMKEEGYRRIWDCGNSVFVFKNK